jgi:hypothetical protein
LIPYRLAGSMPDILIERIGMYGKEYEWKAAGNAL